MVGLFLAGPRDRPELGGISIPWSRGGRLTGASPPPQHGDGAEVGRAGRDCSTNR